jgi:hypothetical protein
MKASVKPGVIFPETADEENISCELIHDIIDGKPYLYKSNSVTLQHIVISDYLLKTLFEGLRSEQNLMIASGPGLYIDERNVFTSNIMIFERSELTIDENYAQVPPKITLEIDIKVELRDMTEDEYVFLKGVRLVNFGAEKVIWFFTESKKVIIVTPVSWITYDWDRDVTIMQDITCNVAQFLHREDSEFA